VPITDWKDRYDEAVWMTKVEPSNDNGLSKTSAADAFQVRSVSKDRFVEKLGNIHLKIWKK
jgi:mRNA interferase MazF